jgi:exosortase A
MASTLRISAALPRAGSWPAAAGAAAAAILGLLLLYRDTLAGLIELWWESSSYNYAFLVTPIAVYLACERRGRLARLQPRPCLPALLLLPALAVAWWVADLGDLAEGRQLAVVAMLPAAVLAVLGWRPARVLALPLLYLFLMVPMGDLLVGRLQLFAAATVEWALRCTGIPVFRDGVLLEVPSGSFVVETGCAGLNFLLSALALSLLFADLLFRRAAKRLACVAVALGAALVVNWIRIYGVILISELSGGGARIIRDHLVYGWGLFAVAMVGLVIIAQARRDGSGPAAGGRGVATAPPGASAAAFLATGLASLLLAGGVSAGLGSVIAPASLAIGSLPRTVGAWHLARQQSGPGTLIASYDGPPGRVELEIRAFRQGAEDLMRPAQMTGDWSSAAIAPASARIDGATVTVHAVQLSKGRQRETSWRWLAVGGRFTADWLAGLVAQGLTVLASGTPPCAIALRTGATDAPEALLQAFLDDWNVGATLRATHQPRSF